MALYIGAQVRAYAGGASSLIVTSTVRDQAYQHLLVRRNREATRSYSLHTTGWAFDVARVYRDGRHAQAFQFVLDRLQVLNVIAWVREPDAIHITVSASRGAEPLLARWSPAGSRPLLAAVGRARARRPRRGAGGGAGLVGRAGGAVRVEQRAVDLQRAGDRLARAARDDLHRRPGRADRLRHEDVEAGELERLDDRSATSSGVEVLKPRGLGRRPAASSVRRWPASRRRSPRPCPAARTARASDRPTTPCLVAQ